MSELEILTNGPLDYSESTNGDVESYTARTDVLGQPTRAFWILDDIGAQRWIGQLNSPSDSSDTIPFTIPNGYAVHGYSLSVDVPANGINSSGSQFYLTNTYGTYYTDRALASFSSAAELQAGQYTIMLGNGLVVLNYTLTLNLVSLEVDLAPSLTGTGVSATYVEGTAGVALFSGVQASTQNSTQTFSALSLQIDGAAGADEFLAIGGTSVALVAGSGTLANGADYILSASGGGLSLSLSGLALDASGLESLLAGISYQNVSEAPSEGARTITLDWLQDSGQTQNSVTPNLTATVNVQAVNDAPVVGEVDLGAFEEDGGTRSLTVAELLTASIDAEGDVLSVTGLQILSGGGTLVEVASGKWDYTPNADATGEVRFGFRVSDGQAEVDATAVLYLTAVNDEPVVTLGATAIYTENDPGQPVAADLVLTDVDSPTLASAQISISGGFDAAHDRLAFINAGSFGNIVGSYNGAAGVLTLTSAGASASLAQWQAALRTVSFSSTSDAPAASRTVQIVAYDAEAGSQVVSQTLVIAAQNDAPELSAPATLSVLESAMLAISGIAVADADAADAELTLTLSVDHGVLVAVSGSAVTVGGDMQALTLTGTQQALNSYIAANHLTYAAPTNDLRSATLMVQVSDGGASGGGGAQADARTLTLEVININDAPVLSGFDTSVDYTDGGAAVRLAPAAQLADLDTDTALGGVDDLAGARLVLARQGGASAEDVFGFASGAAITAQDGELSDNGLVFATYTVANGRLEILFDSSGTVATRARVEAVMQLVDYRNASLAPEGSVGLEWSFTDSVTSGQGAAQTVTTITAVELTDIDRVPSLSVDSAPRAYTEGGSAIAIGQALTSLVDDSEELTASVVIGNYREGDALSFELGTSGVDVVDLGNGHYELSAAAPSVLLTVLQSTLFESVSEDPVSANGAARYVKFSVADEASRSVVAGVTVEITGINDAPQLSVLKSASVQNGRSLTLTSAVLEARDPDDAPTDLLYEITTLPSGGQLRLDGVVLEEGDRFTQADVAAGRVIFVGVALGQQSLGLSLRDGGEDGAASTDFSLVVTVTAPPAPPIVPPTKSDTVDGITVEKATVDNGDGTQSTIVTIPVVTESRVDDSGDASLADIPLVTTSSGTSLLAVALPNGVGLQASGSSAPSVASIALDGLLQQIESHSAPSDITRAQMLAGANDFLQQLVLDTHVVTQTIAPVGGGQVSSPLIVTGSGVTTALVIDAGNAAAGTSLVLDNVDFAAVIGDIVLSAGSGSQVIWADAANQVITLGGGDKVYAGGGNDQLVFAAGGTGQATLHGGAGRDQVSFSGNIADYELIQSFASITLKPLAGRSDAITVVNAEVLQFNDGDISVRIDPTVEWLAGLYQQVLGRQADLGGIEFWADALGGGVSKAAIMSSMLTSHERGVILDTETSAARSETLDLIYQSFLGRDADEAGKAFWDARLQAGTSLSEVLDGFANSIELIGHAVVAEQQSFII